MDLRIKTLGNIGKYIKFILYTIFHFIKLKYKIQMIIILAMKEGIM